MPGYGDFMLPPIGCTANTAPIQSQCAAKEAALREALEEHMERPQD
jgi:hypothetical protein